MIKHSSTNESVNYSVWQKLTTYVGTLPYTVKQGFVSLSKTYAENQHRLLPTLNGLVGDTLAEIDNPLAINMSFRERGRDVAVNALNSHSRLSGNGKHLVIFVHGLMGGESLWQKTGEVDKNPKYGALLAQDLGITPLYIRYNSGLHISENGQRLNQLLTELVSIYGEAIQKITLVGYSMGGLVVRSAGYYAEKIQQDWLTKLSSVILISVPNEGSYLAQLGHLIINILRTIPNIPTRLIAHIMDSRHSNGIKDLRYGFMVEEDWKRAATDQRFSVNRTHVDLLPNVNYHLIAGTITEDDKSLMAWFFGDGLVGKRSAMGSNTFSNVLQLSKSITYKTFPRKNHTTILTDLEVYQYLRSLLETKSTTHELKTRGLVGKNTHKPS